MASNIILVECSIRFRFLLSSFRNFRFNYNDTNVLPLRENRPPESVESIPANDGKAQIKSLVVPAHLFVCLLSVAVVGCCIAMSMPMVHLPNYAKSIGFSIEEVQFCYRPL